MYLLDTNHCSRAILGDHKILNSLKDREQDLIATCAIVQGELIDMAERSQKREANLALVNSFLQGISIYAIDSTTATLYGQIKASIFKKYAPKEKSKRRKTKIVNLGFGENDLWIAAVALQHKLTIVTSDSDFLRIQAVFTEITLESWV